jgi:heavy metal sensor kinase
MMNKLNNLRLRLVIWTITLEFLLIVVFGILLVVVIQKTQNQQIDESLRLSASQLNAVVDTNGIHFQVSSADRNTLTSQGIIAWIMTPTGKIDLSIGDVDLIPFLSILTTSNTLIDSQLKSGEPVRLFITDLSEGNRTLGTIVVAKSLRASQTFLWEVVLSLVVAVPILLLLSVAGGLFLANRALSPIDAITKTARQISAEDLSRRLGLQLPNDEIGELAHTFDAMLERLETAFLRERQLTADVSHELRTPLGILKTQLSLARSRPRDASTLLRMMADMEEDVDRMTRLAEQMLILTRVEQGGLVNLEHIDLGEVLETVFVSWEPKAQACNVLLAFTRDEHIILPIKGDVDRLYQVFSNLIDNAIKYTSPESIIRISVSQNKAGIEVIIADQGVGIAPEHLHHLFERFYRVDSARTRTTGGVGLGLAISYAIVQAHGGKLQVESQVGQGTTFTVILPVAISKQSQIFI